MAMMYKLDPALPKAKSSKGDAGHEGMTVDKSIEGRQEPPKTIRTYKTKRGL